jgi:hypothetical protein
MTKQELEATWVPRIGEKATMELGRFRRVGMIAIVTWSVLAVAAGVAFSGNTLDRILGVVLVAAIVGAFAVFIRCQLRVKAAISDWFGVRIKGLPLMNPKAFDRYCEKQGLQRPGGESTLGENERGASSLP